MKDKIRNLSEYSEEDWEGLRQQLRQPSGERGIEIALLMNEGNFHINRLTIDKLEVKDGESVLEVGMGNGLFVERILEKAQQVSYTGLDYSKEMVEQAQKINDRFSDQQASFLHGQIEGMPFDEASFDHVLTINTIYFWSDIERTLKEVRRVLKPEGSFLISLRPRSLMETYPFTHKGFTMYESRDISELLIDNGFREISSTTEVEPEQEIFGELGRRVSLIVCGKK